MKEIINFYGWIQKEDKKVEDAIFYKDHIIPKKWIDKFNTESIRGKISDYRKLWNIQKLDNIELECQISNFIINIQTGKTVPWKTMILTLVQAMQNELSNRRVEKSWKRSLGISFLALLLALISAGFSITDYIWDWTWKDDQIKALTWINDSIDNNRYDKYMIELKEAELIYEWIIPNPSSPKIEPNP